MNNNIFHTKGFKANLKRYEEAKAAGSSVYLEPEDFSDIAEYYHLHGRLAEALGAVDYALQIFPGATDPLAFRARIAIIVEHDAEKAMHYADMIADKYDLEYYYIVAEIYLADGKCASARAFLKEMQKNVADEELEDFYLDVATLFADYDKYDLASEVMALCEDTEEPDYQELYGRIQLNMGNYNEAKKSFAKLVDLDPYSVTYWNHLATTNYFLGNLGESMESCDFALAIAPDDTESLLNKANCLTMMGNYDEAFGYYSRYKELQPMSEVADMGMAAVLMAQNKLAEAKRHWQSAAKMCQPHSANAIDIFRNICLVDISLMQFDEAEKNINKIEALNNGATSDSLILRGYLSLSTNDTLTAADYFAKACAAAPMSERDNTLFSIAYSFYDCGYMQEAHDALRMLTASSKGMNDSDIWSYLARTDYELGLMDEFLEDLQKAIKNNPTTTQRELADIFPSGMDVADFYDYAIRNSFSKQ